MTAGQQFPNHSPSESPDAHGIHRSPGDADYRLAVDKQARAMLALATSRHSEFAQDCRTDPGQIVNHWSDDVTIGYVHALAHTSLNSSSTATIDDQNDLLGLFSPAMQAGERNVIRVQFNEGREYTARRNFTLLHELGHYLQQTDDVLADQLFVISSANYNKRFEESACNRFASLSLLPDDYVTALMAGEPLNAIVARDIFESGRGSGKSRRMRVSRPVVVRRMADFLPSHGSIALVQDGNLNTRVHADGVIDYGGEPTPAERAGMDAYHREHSEPYATGLVINHPNAPTAAPPAASSASSTSVSKATRVSIAHSYGRSDYFFIVTAPQP
ncbi:ImmA/IrrE family metallo-endopeptidase [Bifidobacterium biavatii]|uniref:Putative Zn peptidase n=1 Tax=Bifidobacterium biavatii DSM 23969 TaxID=1437608 RepID=A0A087A0D2_9BIFI|nr:ImmA/IrrE family metallo-endopeptidase [Bifidobacterium biavatii]KFI52232.1 putative Zn peptidase [Bifidobacterium biavatii DSM 23969]